MIEHNDCFPCEHYRNFRNEKIYCQLGLEDFANPKQCKQFSPEPGCDYEPTEKYKYKVWESLKKVKKDQK